MLYSFMSMPPSKLFDGEVASDSFQDDVSKRIYYFLLYYANVWLTKL